MTRNSFFIRSFLLLALGVLASCVNDDVQKSANAEFEKRFSSSVAEINSSRTPPPPNSHPSDIQSTATTPRSTSKFASPSEILGISGSAEYSSASVNTAKLALKPQEDFSPDQQILAAAKAAQSKLPNDMFDLTYNTALSPPFISSGIEFDVIKIPERDYYGVASTLNDKRYYLAGNQILQRNIDDLMASRSAEDIELSEILIREQKQLKKQQKLAKIFGEDSAFSKEEKTKEEKKEEVATAPDAELRKAIALQIIQQNLTRNSAAATQNQGNASATVAQNNVANQQRKQ